MRSAAGIRGWRALFNGGVDDQRFVTELSLALPGPLKELPRTVLEVRPLATPGGWLVLVGGCAAAPCSNTRLGFGFCNNEAECDRLRRIGVTVFESEITGDGQSLRVALNRLLSFGPGTAATATLVITDLAARDALDAHPKQAQHHRPPQAHALRYQRWLSVPDAASPNEELALVDLDETVTLHQIPAPALAVDIRLGCEESLLVRAKATWVTTWPPMFADDPGGTPDQADKPATDGTGPVPQPTVVGPARRVRREQVSPVPPAYRFDQVEAIGFRLNLLELGLTSQDVRTLTKSLIAPLNPRESNAGTASADLAQDFSYEPASGTLLLELLRYPSMRLGDAQAGRYQCQHELLLRLLVGRVDEGSAQAHDPAYFVPAIFVDNVWSKVLGRELQGLNKQLALFCTEDGHALRCDGRNDDNQPVPLQSVSSVRLSPPLIGNGEGATLLRFNGLQEMARPTSWAAVAQNLLLDGLKLAGLAWRPSDFDQKAFRRAFAGQAIRRSLQGFRSVQATEARPPLPGGLIGARFEIEQMQVCQTDGIVELSFEAPEAAPQAWRELVQSLRAHNAATVALAADECYRLRFNMRMTVDDGLAW